MTIENGWTIWAIAFLSLVGAFHIIALVFRWLNEMFDFRALRKFWPLLLLLFFASCGGGGGGGSDDSTAQLNSPPELDNLQINGVPSDAGPQTACVGPECIDHVYIQPSGINDDLGFRLEFIVGDVDMDAKEFHWQVTDSKNNIIDEDILQLPPMDFSTEAYITDIYYTDEVGGPYTFTAYVVDTTGLESNEWVEEFCILADRFDVETCKELRYPL